MCFSLCFCWCDVFFLTSLSYHNERMILVCSLLLLFMKWRWFKVITWVLLLMHMICYLPSITHVFITFNSVSLSSKRWLLPMLRSYPSRCHILRHASIDQGWSRMLCRLVDCSLSIMVYWVSYVCRNRWTTYLGIGCCARARQMEIL